MILDRPLRKGDAGEERLLHLDQCSAPLRIPAASKIDDEAKLERMFL